MAVTAAIIKAEFPEFDELDDAVILPKIADAVLCVNAETWGDRADLGVKYMTAHLLAISPLGEQAKLVAKTGETTYLMTFKKVKATVASGCRVI